MVRIRYYSYDDPEIGVTPSQLKRLGRAKQRDYVIHWFEQNFEDPAHETPYESREGGYQYIWGGPYDAADELHSEFHNVVSEMVINEAVEEVERGGMLYWAPTSAHPDRQHDHDDEQDPGDGVKSIEQDLETIIRRLEAGTRPTYGDAHDSELRQDVLARLDALNEAIRPDLEVPLAGIGHNRPPPDVLVDASEPADLQHAAEAIRAELLKTEPDALTVARKTVFLEKLARWCANKGDMFADSFAQGFGSTSGKAAAVGISAVIAEQVTGIVTALVRWLSYVSIPF